MPRALRRNSLAPRVWNLEAHQWNADQHVLEHMAGINPGAGTPAFPPAPVVEKIWKSTPFSGDFNPGTKLGNRIFIENTKGLLESVILDLSNNNSQEIHKYLQAREILMGNVITKVQIAHNPDGTVKTTANLITQYQQITIEYLQHAAFTRYDTALALGAPIPPAPFTMRNLDPVNDADDKKQFFLRVYCNVVAHIIKNGLSVQGYSELLLKKEKFKFYNADTGEVGYDIPSMMFLFFRRRIQVKLWDLIPFSSRSKMPSLANTPTMLM